MIYTDKILNQRGFSTLRISRRTRVIRAKLRTWQDLGFPYYDMIAFCWFWMAKMAKWSVYISTSGWVGELKHNGSASEAKLGDAILP